MDGWNHSLYHYKRYITALAALASGGTQCGEAEAFVASAVARVCWPDHMRSELCPVLSPGLWESWLELATAHLQASACRHEGCLWLQPALIHWPPRASAAMLADALGHAAAELNSAPYVPYHMPFKAARLHLPAEANVLNVPQATTTSGETLIQTHPSDLPVLPSQDTRAFGRLLGV